MPYERNADLPDPVRETLPEGAQTMYRKAFNNAWDQYVDPRTRQGDASREETAHRVAWSAVKASYEKREGRWVSKSEP